MQEEDPTAVEPEEDEASLPPKPAIEDMPSDEDVENEEEPGEEDVPEEDFLGSDEADEDDTVDNAEQEESHEDQPDRQTVIDEAKERSDAQAEETP